MMKEQVNPQAQKLAVDFTGQNSTEAVKLARSTALEQIQKSKSLMASIFPSESTKLIHAKMEEAALLELDQRIRAFKLETEFTIQHLQERYNSMLSELRISSRKDAYEKIMNAFVDLINQISLITNNYLALSKEKLITIAQEEDKRMQELLEKDFEKERERFFQLKEKALDRFSEISDSYITV